MNFFFMEWAYSNSNDDDNDDGGDDDDDDDNYTVFVMRLCPPKDTKSRRRYNHKTNTKQNKEKGLEWRLVLRWDVNMAK